MLDDLKYIHQRDAQDALGIAQKQWQQLEHEFDLSQLSALSSQLSACENVVFAGMGGSALAATFIPSWPSIKLPFEITKNYSIPSYVSEKTLFIASSYSGNTEETLSALAAAKAQGAQIVVIAAGGKLLELAKENNYPLLQIPAGIQPRMSSFYSLAGLTQLFAAVGLIDKTKLNELQAVAGWLSGQVANYQADVALKNNLAKQIAMELAGKTVIVYSGPLLFPAANKWKICINENAKNLAWANQYPEFNHNEFIGWTSHPVVKPFAVVEIRSNLDNERVQKRFAISEKLLSGKRPAPIVINPEGKTILEQLLWTMVLGDFTSIYLALLNNVNPTPVELVEKLKQELA